jgi:ribosome-binding protein aMBF1 (putative translation factor)
MYVVVPSPSETVTCYACRAVQFLTFKSVRELGHAVRTVRQSRCLSRRQLADLSRTHVSYLSRFESGLVVPNLSTVARVLGAIETERVILRVSGSR